MSDAHSNRPQIAKEQRRRRLSAKAPYCTLACLDNPIAASFQAWVRPLANFAVHPLAVTISVRRLPSSVSVPPVALPNALPPLTRPLLLGADQMPEFRPVCRRLALPVIETNRYRSRQRGAVWSSQSLLVGFRRPCFFARSWRCFRSMRASRAAALIFPL